MVAFTMLEAVEESPDGAHLIAKNIPYVTRDLAIPPSDTAALGLELKATFADPRVRLTKIAPYGRAATSCALALRDEVVLVNGEDVACQDPIDVAKRLSAAARTPLPVRLRVVRERIQHVALKRKRSASKVDSSPFGLSLVQPLAGGPILVAGVVIGECPAATRLPLGTAILNIDGVQTTCRSVDAATKYLAQHDKVTLVVDHADYKMETLIGPADAGGIAIRM